MGVRTKDKPSTPADKIDNSTKPTSYSRSCHPFHGKRAQPSRCRWKNSEGILSVRRFQQHAFLRWHALQKWLQSPPRRDQDPLRWAHSLRDAAFIGSEMYSLV